MNLIADLMTKRNRVATRYSDETDKNTTCFQHDIFMIGANIMSIHRSQILTLLQHHNCDSPRSAKLSSHSRRWSNPSQPSNGSNYALGRTLSPGWSTGEASLRGSKQAEDPRGESPSTVPSNIEGEVGALPIVGDDTAMLIHDVTSYGGGELDDSSQSYNGSTGTNYPL
jgi:hypothetical protein